MHKSVTINIKFSQQRVNALNDVLETKTNFSPEGYIAEFLAAYYICELLAYKLIKYMKSDKHQKKIW